MKAHVKTVAEKNSEYINRIIMRTIKIACVVLAEEFDFGEVRLGRFLSGMTKKVTIFSTILSSGYALTIT